MTGYSPAAAIGRKPSFLQGADTSEASKTLIRNSIRDEVPVRTTILNYKQDGAPYQCHLELLPLRHVSGRVTHFLALEKEL
jgi:PAS domain S-box-containing protein